MPVISATTETRREGYFRREWRLAVERTLDLADDVMFLVPVVIDATRDAGARVPEKFFSVQWLRVPDGQATAELRALADKLATGEAAAIHPPAPAVSPAPRRGQKSAQAAHVPPPFPPFPPFPEAGHRLRFCYELVLWSGRMIHALWMRLPKVVRVIASIVIVFNIISFNFRDTARSEGTRAEKAAKVAALTKTIGAVVNSQETSDKPVAADSIKSLVNAATDALQTGRPLAMVNFGGSGKEAAAYAESIFDQTIRLLQEKAEDKISVSPLPLDGDNDDEVLARGLRLETQFVLTGTARRLASGASLTFTAKLYDVKQRTVVWTETYDAAQTDAATVAQHLAAAAGPRALPAAKP
jgi:TolB-like protein